MPGEVREIPGVVEGIPGGVLRLCREVRISGVRLRVTPKSTAGISLGSKGSFSIGLPTVFNIPALGRSTSLGGGTSSDL